MISVLIINTCVFSVWVIPENEDEMLFVWRESWHLGELLHWLFKTTQRQQHKYIHVFIQPEYCFDVSSHFIKSFRCCCVTQVACLAGKIIIMFLVVGHLCQDGKTRSYHMWNYYVHTWYIPQYTIFLHLHSFMFVIY